MRLNVYLYNMKTNQLNTIVENIISSEVRKRIISEMEEDKKEYYHIMCDGEPVETFNSEDEASEHLDKWKKEHPGKQFIIEKGDYDSHEDMIDKLDEMCDEKEENLNKNMKQPKIKTIEEAIRFAKNKGLKRVKINENIYDVDECWKNMEEEECDECWKNEMEENTEFSDGDYLNDVYEDEECDECGDGQMNEFDDESYHIKGLGFNQDGEPYGFDNDSEECSHCEGFGQHENGETCDHCGGKGHVGGDPYQDEVEEEFEIPKEDSFEMSEDTDFEDYEERYPEEEDPEHFKLNVPEVCSHCHGTGENEFGSVCKKCRGKKHEMGMDKFSSHHKSPRQHYKDISSLMGYPSLNEGKKIIRLSEAEFTKVIKKIVKETIPGLTAAKKSRNDSGKENNQYIKDVDKKMKDYMSFEGNDNPEYPKHIGGKNKNLDSVVKFNNNDKEDEYVADNRGMGLQDVKFDHEPSEQFKQRVKKALEGDSTMGNSQNSPNVLKSKTGENIGKTAKRKRKEIENQPMYKKDVQPVKVVKESIQKKVILESEIDKMKKLYSYNKNSQ
jgi:hypothetical protein